MFPLLCFHKKKLLNWGEEYCMSLIYFCISNFVIDPHCLFKNAVNKRLSHHQVQHSCTLLSLLVQRVTD